MFKFTHKDIDFSHKLDKASTPTEHFFKHLHPFYEILFFVKGNVTYTVESETKKLATGDIVFIEPNKYHFAVVDLSVPYERYVLNFPVTILPSFMIERLSSFSPFIPCAKKFATFFSQMDSYVSSFDNEELHTLLICELMKFLIMISQEPVHVSQKINAFIEKIIKYIDENLKTNITLDTLVEEFHFSKSYINNKFKEYMKIPIMHYIRSKKIVAAHRLILGGEKKMDVAKMYGFDNYSTFYRAYSQFLDSNSFNIT